MGKGGWWVVGLFAACFTVQACGGDELTTGRIITPGASPNDQGSSRQWEYDDGRALWDGSEPEQLGAWEWRGSVSDRRGQWGRRVTVSCVPGRENVDLAVWGDDPYADDSPVCAAAVHRGSIDAERGGTVTIEIRPAQRAFQGVTRNGVTGLSWGPYPGSYVFVD